MATVESIKDAIEKLTKRKVAGLEAVARPDMHNMFLVVALFLNDHEVCFFNYSDDLQTGVEPNRRKHGETQEWVVEVTSVEWPPRNAHGTLLVWGESIRKKLAPSTKQVAQSLAKILRSKEAMMVILNDHGLVPKDETFKEHGQFLVMGTFDQMGLVRSGDGVIFTMADTEYRVSVERYHR